MFRCPQIFFKKSKCGILNINIAFKILIMPLPQRSMKAEKWNAIAPNK